MTRRELLLCSAAVAGPAAAPALAITLDDVAWQSIPEPWQSRASRSLLDALPAQAALFVCGRNVDSTGGRAILRRWSDAGHILANHTWEHENYAAEATDPAQFEAGVLRCEGLLRPLPGFQRLFRFPMLKEGATAARRDRMRAFLAEHGYRNGHVTIDASDWYFDARLRRRLKDDSGFDVNRFREPYVAHMLARADYYERLARRVLPEPIPHILLAHFNLINCLFLADLADAFRARGWRITGAEEVFRHPVFRRQPANLPAGESLVWALAKETGRFDAELRYPAEDGEYEKAELDRRGL